jgi:hypothetical protein
MLFKIFITLVTISCSVLGYEIVPVIIDPNGAEFAPSSIQLLRGSAIRFFFHSNHSLSITKTNPCSHSGFGRHMVYGRRNLTFDYWIPNENPTWFYTGRTRCNGSAIFQLNAGNLSPAATNTLTTTIDQVTITDTITTTTTVTSLTPSLQWSITYWNSSTGFQPSITNDVILAASAGVVKNSTTTSNSKLVLARRAPLSYIAILWIVFYLYM